LTTHISHIDFINEFNIPNSNIDSQTIIQQFIDRYEPEVLKMVLGYELSRDYAAALAGGSPAQKWLDLRDGVEFSFVYDGKTILDKWPGLIGGTGRKSLITAFIYLAFRKEHESYFTGSNEASAKSENSDVADAYPKYMSVWNEMVDMVGIVPVDFNDNETPSVVYTSDPSLYNFLLKNIADYSTWKFKHIEKLNSFGI